MLIANGKLTNQSLAGQVAVVTGAGGGIGFEAARALIWLGVRVVIAEINSGSGRQAEERLAEEFGPDLALFIPTDVGDEDSIHQLKEQSIQNYGQVDIVLNNATLAPLGPVKDVPIRMWDTSYRVNLRGPVLLARAFLPDMLARNRGVFACVSSLGQEYMAPYEAMKAAQAHLGTTLAAELEGSGVSAFTIGPGYVSTDTARNAIPQLAELMGKTPRELFEIVRQYELPVEAAGAGFAAAIALAERYRGQEISSAQALIDAGIELSETQPVQASTSASPESYREALPLCRRVRDTLAEQSAGWKDRSVFEQQWLKRTFRRRSGMPAEQWLDGLNQLEKLLEVQDAAGIAALRLPFEKLEGYYGYLYEMAKGYVKDPAQREEQLGIVRGWQEDVSHLSRILNTAE